MANNFMDDLDILMDYQNILYQIEMESDDSEQEELEVPRDAIGRKKKVHRQRKDPFTYFDDDAFRRRYRLSKGTVRNLAAHYGLHSNTKGEGLGCGLSTAERFCLALRYFATGCNYTVVGDYQGVDKSTVSRAVKDVSDYFYANAERYIQFPETFQEMQVTAAAFFAKFGHPRLIGCIDGTHIEIKKPTVNEGAYFNRKGWCSLNPMVICDADRKIIGLDVGWAGSVADAYAFNSSELRREADTGFLGQFFILGDSGYPLKPYLFTPVARPTNDREVAYNSWHRTTRALVEQTIGILKQRFRCLDGSAGYLCHEPDVACKIIVACAALHNVAHDTGVGLDMDNDEDAHNPRRVPRRARQQPENVPIRHGPAPDRDTYIDARFT